LSDVIKTIADLYGAKKSDVYVGIGLGSEERNGRIRTLAARWNCARIHSNGCPFVYGDGQMTDGLRGLDGI
jgi:hypothetical protein